MYLTKIIRDGVEFRLTHNEGLPVEKRGMASYWLWTSLARSKDFEGARQWKLPHVRTLRRLAKKFVGDVQFHVDLERPHSMYLDLPIGLPREDRAAFLAAVVVNTKIQRME